MKLRELIRAYRESHDLSQRQFAIKCNLSNGYISILEKGINPNTGKPVMPTLPQLKKLADGMSMTLNELFEQADDMPIDLVASDLIFTPVEIPSTSAFQFYEYEVEMIRKFRCLDSRGQAAVLNVLNYEFESLAGEKADSSAKEA